MDFDGQKPVSKFFKCFHVLFTKGLDLLLLLRIVADTVVLAAPQKKRETPELPKSTHPKVGKVIVFLDKHWCKKQTETVADRVRVSCWSSKNGALPALRNHIHVFL